MYAFYDKYKLGKPYIYIHPYKQHYVKEIVDKAFDGITHIIVFGSATRLSCNANSDIDICVIGDIEDSELGKLRIPGVPIDIAHYTDVDELRNDKRLYEEILRKGVRVYG